MQPAVWSWLHAQAAGVFSGCGSRFVCGSDCRRAHPAGSGRRSTRCFPHGSRCCVSSGLWLFSHQPFSRHSDSVENVFISLSLLWECQSTLIQVNTWIERLFFSPRWALVKTKTMTFYRYNLYPPSMISPSLKRLCVFWARGCRLIWLWTIFQMIVFCINNLFGKH